MEDNEFEEVTIISHTDLCSSVLPQATAERLMREIRLEVTQKISPTENVKLGSLQDPEAERRLNKIQEVMLSPDFVVDQDLHNYHNSLADPEAMYLVGASQIYATQFGLMKNPTDKDHAECYFAAEIGPFGLFFYHSEPVQVYNTETKTWSHLTHNSNVDIGEEPAVAHRGVYYKTKSEDIFRLACISIDESGNLTDVLCPEPKTMSLVSADRVNGSVVVLDQKGTLWRDGYSNELIDHSEYHHGATCLKQMYSDHFLVGLSERHGQKSRLYLVDRETLEVEDELEFETGFSMGISFNLRMLAPRTADGNVFHFVLALNGNEVLCICQYQQKLYHITRCPVHAMMYGLSHLHKDSWIAFGRTSAACSLIVEFPKALRVC